MLFAKIDAQSVGFIIGASSLLFDGRSYHPGPLFRGRFEVRLGPFHYVSSYWHHHLPLGGALEHAQTITNHESPRTTKLYDRTREELSRERQRGRAGIRFWKDVAIVAATVLVAFAVHLVEIAAWVLAFMQCGEFPD